MYIHKNLDTNNHQICQIMFINNNICGVGFHMGFPSLYVKINKQSDVTGFVPVTERPQKQFPITHDANTDFSHHPWTKQDENK